MLALPRVAAVLAALAFAHPALAQLAYGNNAGQWGFGDQRSAELASIASFCAQCAGFGGECAPEPDNVPSGAADAPIVPYAGCRLPDGGFISAFGAAGLNPCNPNLYWNCQYVDAGRQATKMLGTPSICEGNPCDVASGNKWQTEVDYVGSGPFPLRFVRTFNSLGTVAGTLGGNWTHTYERRLHFSPNPSTPTVVTAQRDDGRTVSFRRIDDRWEPDGDVSERLLRRDGQWVLVDAEDVTETYSARGLLLSLTDRVGRTHRLAYSDRGDLISVTDAFGRVLRLAWEAAGGARYLREIIDPSGTATRYERRGGLITRVSHPDGASRTYIYGDASAINGGAVCPIAARPLVAGLLTGIIDARGNRYGTWTYDCGGRVTSSRNGTAANAIAIQYGADGNRTVTDALGVQRTHRFATASARGVLVGIDGAPSNRPKEQRFDVRGNVIATIDWNGVATTFAYEPTRNLQTQRVEATGTAVARTITTQWHPQWRLPVRIAEPKRITTFDYDPDGSACGAPSALCSVTREATNDANGAAAFGALPIGTPRTWRFTYDRAGQVVTADGPRTDVSDIATYTYDAQGNPTSAGNALGQRTRFTSYDAHGNLLESVDPNGVVTRLAYDARQRLLRRQLANEVTRYDYDPNGRLERLTQPDGSAVAFTYDDAQRLVGITESGGARLAYSLDAMGNRTATTLFDASGAIVQASTQKFDALGRLAESIGAANQRTTFSYDDQGNRLARIDPLGQQALAAYDALNRIVRATDAAGGATRVGYDGLDQLFALTDPREVTTGYDQDGLGNRVRTVSPDAGVATQTFDAAGNVVARVDARGVLTTIAYDALDRPIEERIALGRVASLVTRFGYDTGPNSIGRLSSLFESDGRSRIANAWAYDTQARVVERIQQVDAATTSVQYAYAPLTGQLASMRLPSGRTLAYTYDADGRIASIALDGRALVAGVRYFPFGGPLAGFQWADGARYIRTFDRDARIRTITLGASTRSIDYDDAGRIVAIADSALPGLSRRFAYDANGRLTGYEGYPANQSFAYDANGNRTVLAVGARLFNQDVEPASNRMRSVATPSMGGSVTYDGAGSVVSGGRGEALRYDARGRLASLATSAGTITYTVNRLGQRVRKLAPEIAGQPSLSTLYVYDEAGRLLGEYDTTRAAQPRIEYVYLQDVPVAAIVGTGESSAIYNVWVDHLDTPRLLTDAQGRARWRWESAPFGETPADEDPSKLGLPVSFSLRFPGQLFDRESGLHYNYFRDYDPAIGRYLQSDPIGLAGGINPYAYVEGNPISLFDRQGLLCPWCLPFFAFGFATWDLANSDVPVLGAGLAGAGVRVGEAACTVAAKGATSLWPAASGGRTVINGLEYSTHALERMQPVGTVIKDGAMFSRGVPPSAVENAVKLGKVTPGNSAAEVVRTFENVRVITNPEATRVISVIKIGN